MGQNILKALEKIILPVSQGWSISDIEINDKKSEVYVDLIYYGLKIHRLKQPLTESHLNLL